MLVGQGPDHPEDSLVRARPIPHCFFTRGAIRLIIEGRARRRLCSRRSGRYSADGSGRAAGIAKANGQFAMR
jgi:hypothetical protein